MKNTLFLTGWGLPDYASAAAGALRAFPDADVLGVSRRRLVEVLLAEGKGREDVYVLGVSLRSDVDAFARAVEQLDGEGVSITYVSAMDLPEEAASLRHSESLTLKVCPNAKSLTAVVGELFRIDVDDLLPYAKKTTATRTAVAQYQELFAAAGYAHRNSDDDTVYVEAIRNLARPITPAAWAPQLREAVEDYRKYGDRELIGDSQAMKDVSDKIAKAARHPKARVLILGDSGTGKETVAQQIHRRSVRKDGNFIPFNCASVTPNLLEARMFGYEKGAFTSADKQTDGLFAKAKGGTLFLDEIGELPFEAQGLLLRVLQEGKYQRLGGTESIEADVRLITATNRDLPSMVREGKFRRDLFQRLCVIEIKIPPLEERKEDLKPIANDWWIRNTGSPLTDRQIDDLMDFKYEGNVRELVNLLERALVLEETDFKKLIEEYKEINAGLFAEDDAERNAPLADYPENLEEMTRCHVRRIYNRYGKKGLAAEHLGISPNTLNKYL